MGTHVRSVETRLSLDLGGRTATLAESTETRATTNSFNAGAAYVFVREGTTWTQQAYLKASNTLFSADEGFIFPDSFGISVAIDQDTIVVGARYEDSGSSGVNGDQSLANANGDSGAAYVFVREGDTWSQQAFLKQSNNFLFMTPGGLADSQDNFGGSVAVSGDTIAIAASLEDGGSQGINGDQTTDDEFNLELFTSLAAMVRLGRSKLTSKPTMLTTSMFLVRLH